MYESKILKEFEIMLMRRETEEALVVLERACKVQPTVKLLNNLGWFYMKIGTKNKENDLWYYAHKKAIEPLTQATKMCQSSHYPFTNLAAAYISQNDYDMAGETLEKSVSIEKAVVNQNNLACILFANKQYTRAQVIMRELVNELHNTSMLSLIKRCGQSIGNIKLFSILYNYACVEIALANHKDAKGATDLLEQYYTEGLIEIDDVDVLSILALRYALGDFNGVVSLYPEYGYQIDIPSFGMYYSSLIMLGRHDDAEAYYQQMKSDLESEADETRANSPRYVEYALADIAKRADKIDSIYAEMEKNPSPSFEIIPQIMDTGYYFSSGVLMY